jgi:integrase
MATYREHLGRVTATVRVKPFKSASKTFAKRADAKQWATEQEKHLRKLRDGGESTADLTRLSIGELIRDFLGDPQTQALRYRDSLAMLLAWWAGHYGSTKVLALNVRTLREAREALRPARSPATVNRYLSAMRSCWNWGRASGLVPQEKGWPTRLMLTEPKGRTRYLADAELAELLKAAASHSPTMLAAVQISIGCGVRQGELRRLRWADVDLERQQLRVLLSKNNEARAVYLPTAAVEALRALKRGRVIGQHVIADEEGQQLDRFRLLYAWRLIRDAAGLTNFRWHDLRHSCASILAQQGAGLLEIGKTLGHRSPSVTWRYSHLVEAQPTPAHLKLDEKLRRT